MTCAVAYLHSMVFVVYSSENYYKNGFDLGSVDKRRVHNMIFCSFMIPDLVTKCVSTLACTQAVGFLLNSEESKSCYYLTCAERRVSNMYKWDAV
jgi:hypothetical protein